MQRLETQDDLARAVDHLVRVEPRFATIVERHGLPPLRHAEPGLGSLLRIVTDQLISLQAGQAIWGRLAESLGDFAPHAVLAVPEEGLRALGLSGAKARAFHAAAKVFAAADFAEHESLAEPELFRRLTNITGIGPWTAHIYLLTVLKSADAWPAADLALQAAAQDLLALPARPTSKQMTEIAAEWRPVRGAAALLLWSHYRGVKGIPQG